MDAPLFDQITRRFVLAGLAGSLAGFVGGDAAEARKRRKRKKRRKKQTKPNALGCVNVGDFCKVDDDCCSGICEGLQGKKSCRAHDEGLCAGQSPCDDSTVCGAHEVGVNCFCFPTTGESAFCGRFGACRECVFDADCEAEFGAGAACVVFPCSCTSTPGNTGCVAKCNEPDESA